MCTRVQVVHFSTSIEIDNCPFDFQLNLETFNTETCVNPVQQKHNKVQKIKEQYYTSLH